MERYRKALKKSYLPHIILVPVIILLVAYCIIECKTVGKDVDMSFLEYFFWGLLLLTAFLTWLYFYIYNRRLKKIKEELPDIKEQLENCSLSFNDTHFFLNEYFVSFEIPLAVRYEDITSVIPIPSIWCHRWRKYDESYIELKCQNGKKWCIRNFTGSRILGSPIKSNEENRRVFYGVAEQLKKRYRYAQFV
ncbi:MAG: hypothetical protein J6U00_01000 [Ruminococcus sp.]|uniref:hypothetical protein n=1 Tax=Ruminococcus sp. TaxID=41978 RepID=UPI001B2DC311|nr:hypothetical protein [Ruminococcus sp.]MBO7472576.1 hypothetical protein [Ruminococcus sp.]